LARSWRSGTVADVPEQSRIVASDSVPRISWEVRRRRYGDRSWLVRRNDIYELDPVTDAVWVGCIERLTIEQIVRRVAEISGAPTARALKATVTVLRQLEDLGFVELEQAEE
jgi:hypothetical protein